MNTSSTRPILTRCLLAALALAMLLTPNAWTPRAHAQTQPNLIPLFFTGVVGGETQWGRKVLLRWYTVDQILQLETAVIFRTNASSQREKVSIVRRTRSPQTIKSIFNRPGEEKIYQSAAEMLTNIYGSAGNTPDEFVARVIDLLEGEDASDYAGMRSYFAQQANYGFALVEGNGYLDYVDPAEGPFVYELWQGDAMGNPIDALGRIVIDANIVTPLPAPQNLIEVQLKGRDGIQPARANDRRIYLDWDPASPATANSTFGYNVYRLNRKLQAGEDFEDVKGELIRVNRLPILEKNPLEDEGANSFAFSDQGDWLNTQDEADLLPVGAEYAYWAVARDLLGQEGLPSNPVEVVVRDTFEPDAPRNLQAFPDKDDDDKPFVHLKWNPVPVDTVAYRLYRYQEYGHTRSKGPFADIGGLTEGLIAEVPAPPNPQPDRISYEDKDISSLQKTIGFWYCATAVDGSGNESSLSPPVYVALDDVVGPKLERVTQLCVSRPVLSVSGTHSAVPPTAAAVEGTGDDRGATQAVWQPAFAIEKLHPAYDSVKIWAVFNPSTPDEVATEIFDISLPAGLGDTIVIGDPDPSVQDQTQIPTYRFQAFSFDGQTASVDVAPPFAWVPGSQPVTYRVRLEVSGYTTVCDTTPQPRPAVFPVIPGGSQPPFKLDLACDSDVVSVRLYRSVDGGQSYQLVVETGCEDNKFELIDSYHPEGLVAAKYSIVSVDKHGNLGPPNYLAPTILYMGELAKPTMSATKAVGTPGNRQAQIRWIGPKSGVAFWRLYFVAGNQNPNPQQAVEIPHNSPDLTYDNATNIYEFTTSKSNRDDDPIIANQEYFIAVEAVPMAGAAKRSDFKSFQWDFLNKFGQGTNPEFRWAARPLPPVEPYPISDVNFYTDHKGVLIRVEYVKELGQTDPIYAIEPPYMLWRRRTDKPSQPWKPVTPVIESINFTGLFLDDPFFTFEEEFVSQQDLIYIKDDTGHVEGATYEYYFMDLNPKTFEIDRMMGPITVSILIPG